MKNEAILIITLSILVALSSSCSSSRVNINDTADEMTSVAENENYLDSDPQVDIDTSTDDSNPLVGNENYSNVDPQESEDISSKVASEEMDDRLSDPKLFLKI